ncbi:response regulator [Halomonas sp. ANAO-440]|uniref:HD domain-containing phosphohydrolase n=1 Tax=Halomonas sp. ANAO-440 TaxID=2861360 RepID=UPI001CAA4500|nr:HD domain-containing phosphohydrolase [Halomonas sp. ANAO-440]MBZ0330768.1 response regulator [Halomonas sp. ANAO-440]
MPQTDSHNDGLDPVEIATVSQTGEMASQPPPATLLLVDSDADTLALLAATLEQEGCRLLTAKGGEAALTVLDEEDIDLVMANARMPDMGGIDLLNRIQQGWPQCLRILLDSQSDMNAIVRAINEGHIYSFIGIPWKADELCQTLRQALAHQQSERERDRLEQLTQEQNRELIELNASLEKRVEARSQELEQLSAMLEAAYTELEQSHVTTTRVFSSLINLRLPSRLQTNAQVDALVQAYCEVHELEDELKHDLLMAAALYNLGRLSWNDHMLTTPSQRLFAEDQKAYQRYPEVGESLLMALNHLDGTARIVRHHRERWNGGGYPDQLEQQAIPFGARLLGLAVDFIELQRGMILPNKLPRQQALELLRKFSGRVYDPELCASFLKLCLEQAPDLGVIGESVISLDSSKLQPGMVLAQDLYSEAGMLLLHEGKQLTRALIDKLLHFEEVEEIRYSLLIKKPESDG